MVEWREGKMHGRKQKDREAEEQEAPEIKNARIAKFKKLRRLLETGLEARAAKDESDGSLELSAKLLCINPSVNTLWNLRRDILVKRCEFMEDEAKKAVVNKELILNGEALQKGNVKSHEAWSHRFWTVDTLAEGGRLANLEHEFQLCKKLLTADERNFHCYQYRAGLCRLAGKTAQDDLNFAQQLIDRNFSNYSAWHLKIKALESLETQSQTGDLGCKILSEELELVNNALFTEPDDQSGWMYHRWLVDRLKPNHLDYQDIDRLSLIQQQISLCLELNEMEQNQSKWSLLALIHLTEMESKYKEVETQLLGSKLSIKDLYATLIEIDPSHARYYEYKLSKHQK